MDGGDKWPKTSMGRHEEPDMPSIILKNRHRSRREYHRHLRPYMKNSRWMFVTQCSR